MVGREENAKPHLLIMLPLPPARLQQNKTLRPLQLLLTKRLPLPMLHSQIIRRPVDKLERGQYLREVLTRGLEQGQDVVEFGKREDDVVG